ncbi:TetR/AcrR family transcriptional regulator [Citricoccus sp.]|uniref:TetR/AcrR family transcriptional regulator n=1 Tax=Citricoccus sp. TaxID=1978372 RepID=UPI0028BD9268|nr:TetR/AcrR family transcriptional regulator [Citricoccus sp.]
MTLEPAPSRSVEVRSLVVEAAVELFSERGFEATSVDDLARAAGLSRSTYFRQVGGKEDAVFADHPPLIEELGAWMDEQPSDPWTTVCAASERVFAHLSEDLELARRRYAVVGGVQALRDREIVTERRYEQLFSGHLRRTVPGLEPVDAIGFAALVTATHNHFLRQAVRSDGDGDRTTSARVTERYAQALDRALAMVRLRFGVGSPADAESDAGRGRASHPADDAGPAAGADLTAGSGRVPDPTPAPGQVVVASFPTTMPSGEVLRRVRQALESNSP